MKGVNDLTYQEYSYLLEYKRKNKEKEEKSKLEQIKKIELKKEQEKEEKQYIKDLKIANYHSLYDYFMSTFEKAKPKNELEIKLLVAQFYNLENKKKYIQENCDTVLEQDNIEEIYYKTLKNVEKEWQNHIKALSYNELIEKQKKITLEEISKKNCKNIKNYKKTLIYLLLFGFSFVLAFNFTIFKILAIIFFVLLFATLA